jgi:hypothetical protein
VGSLNFENNKNECLSMKVQRKSDSWMTAISVSTGGQSFLGGGDGEAESLVAFLTCLTLVK